MQQIRYSVPDKDIEQLALINDKKPDGDLFREIWHLGYALYVWRKGMEKQLVGESAPFPTGGESEGPVVQADVGA